MLIHWLACTLGMLAQIQGTLRTDAVEAGVLARVGAGEAADEHGLECFGCVRGDVAYEAYCQRDCLTSCELDVAARLGLGGAPGAEPFLEEVVHRRDVIAKQETWICR